ncbi:MAG TPA: Fe-S cluster assembly protein SufD, partial [Vicinamibacteria bacterium]
TTVSVAPAADKETLPVALARLLERAAPGAEGAGHGALRRAALDRFRERGLPTTRDEDWRFTSVAPLARTAFVPAEASKATSDREIDPYRLPSAVEMVFVDGLYAPSLSRVGAEGVAVASLRECLVGQGATVEPHLGRLLGETASPFADLNTALHEDGAVVEVAPRSAVALPIHLLFFSTGKAPVARFPRVLVLARAGSQATLVETYVGTGPAASLTCAVTEIVVEENAVLRRYKLQDEAEAAFHLSTLAARLARNGRFHDLSVSLGAALSRHDLTVTLDAEGAETSLDGLFFADGDRHTDTHTLIDHARPHGTSRQIYKGIVDGRGRGVFTGRVLVRKDAQKTDAAQSNKNLLLSREALVHGAPQLEILADDVKCRHGATTGQLDEAAVFYLRSRGLSEAAARGLLTAAFAGDLIGRIALPALRERVSTRLLSRLPGAAQVREAAL